VDLDYYVFPEERYDELNAGLAKPFSERLEEGKYLLKIDGGQLEIDIDYMDTGPIFLKVRRDVSLPGNLEELFASLNGEKVDSAFQEKLMADIEFIGAPSITDLLRISEKNN